ncbi:MAG: helix-hairpin-helix domain-containing protein [Bacteroidales bacterium]|nr:helix-hairpin-helix domain-containing protein [Bacteroidales bacterium]
MKKNGKEFFHISISEWKGIFVLAILIFFISFIPLTIDIFYKPQIKDFNKLDSIATELQNNRALALEDKNNKSSANYDNWSINSLDPFPFNPNTISAQDFKKIGFTDKQTQSFINYRSAGAKFYTKKDFKKLYFINDEIYELLSPYILLPDSFIASKQSKKIKEQILVELNTVDSINLIKVPGIGGYRAKKILELRNKLGGFTDYDQLKMIYGFNDSLIETLKPYININPYIIKKININKASIKELARHPYIGYNLSISIYNYRQNHGNYNSVEELKKLKLINDSIYNKILPYITVE